MPIFSPHLRMLFRSDLPPSATAQLLARHITPRLKKRGGGWQGERRRDDGFMGFADETGFSIERDPKRVTRYTSDRPAITGRFAAEGGGTQITVDVSVERWTEGIYYVLLAFSLALLYVFAKDGRPEQGLVFSTLWLAITALSFGVLQRRTFGVDAEAAEKLLSGLFTRRES